MNTSYYSYWGKLDDNNFHLLTYHSLDVAAVGHVLLNNNDYLCHKLSKLVGIEESSFKQWAVFFLSLHDIGKFSDSFQNLSPHTLFLLQKRTSNREYSARHDSLGFLLWKEALKEVFVDLDIFPSFGKRRGKPKEYSVINTWMAAVTGHHGEPPQILREVLNLHFEVESDFLAVSDFVKDAYTLLINDKTFPSIDIEKIETASWWIAGFSVLCDWLGSNTDYFPYRSDNIPLNKYWKKSLLKAEKAIANTGLLSPNPAKKISLNEIIATKDNVKIKPTPLQLAAQTIKINQSPHLFILEDVTGAGKTEAAVLLTHRLMQKGLSKGVYFALPTMATANAMYSRLAMAYKNLYEEGSMPSLVLAHAASALSDEFRSSIIPLNAINPANYGDNTMPAGSHCNHWLADNRKKSLLADIGVGTIDQALLAILPSRHQSLRLLGLLNKTLIVDEVHACDAYMQTLLCALIKAHAASGGNVILLSATLPLKQRKELIDAYATGQNWSTPTLKKTGIEDYPLMTCFSEENLSEEVVETRESVKRSVNVDFIHHKKELESLFSKVVKNNQCACWIRNTVVDAKESYEWLKKKHPNWDIDLFHARFAMGDRLDIENRVLHNFGKDSDAEERKGKILIATQVVEQSLDADWDELVTDLVPIDRVIQRAGRLRRHTRNKLGNRISGKDQRGQVTLRIFSPTIKSNPDSDWYSSFFKKGQYIYENHGQLWLTANLLQRLGKFEMPNDARYLIEGVYGDDAEFDVPEKLELSAWEAEGTSKAKISLATSNALRVDVAYGNQNNQHWWDESRTPTRLGDDTITVYLGRWQNGLISPWCDKSTNAWAYSSVSLQTHWVSQDSPSLKGISQEKIADCKLRLPAKGKWSVLVILQEITKGEWQGSALNEEGKPVLISYSTQTGLEIK